MDSLTWMSRSKPLSARTRARPDRSAVTRHRKNSRSSATRPSRTTTDSPQPKPTPPRKKKAGPPTPKPSKPQKKSNVQQRRKRAHVGTASQAVQADQQYRSAVQWPQARSPRTTSQSQPLRTQRTRAPQAQLANLRPQQENRPHPSSKSKQRTPPGP